MTGIRSDIPFLEVSKHIARRGHKVSFISTPRNIQRLPKIPPDLIPWINLVQIPLRCFESLPENAEATMDVPYLKLAHDGLDQVVGQPRETERSLYTALGSEFNLSQQDFTELALGLELSGLPLFFGVLGRPGWSKVADSVKLPEEFEDRVKGRGIVWTTWAAQHKILAHKATGGLLTHCGWSSLIEGLHYGPLLIMLPFLYDQGLNARFWDKKIGIEVPRNEDDGSFTKNWVAKSLNLVVVDEEGKAYRDGAKEYSALFGDKDLHDRYMDKCVEHLEKHT
ncbi:hypothetical protein PS2_000491 [Malus domestica]